jgi:hypothetical protein
MPVKKDTSTASPLAAPVKTAPVFTLTDEHKLAAQGVKKGRRATVSPYLPALRTAYTTGEPFGVPIGTSDIPTLKRAIVKGKTQLEAELGFKLDHDAKPVLDHATFAPFIAVAIAKQEVSK